MPPRISIDIREACRPKRTGKGQWTMGVVRELLSRGIPLTLLSDALPPPELRLGSESLELIEGSGLRWHLRALAFLKRERPRFFLSPTSYIVPALAGISVRCVPVVHDLIAFRPEPHDAKAKLIERLTLPRAVRSAVKILTVSDSTAADLRKKFPTLSPANITAVYAGPMHDVSTDRHPDGRTILCISTLCPRKNQERLIRAYASLPDTLRSTFRLVLAGARGWRDDGIVYLARTIPGVEWREYVSDADYRHLMATCEIFALPSLYEGFGMPILDAMRAGVPVLTSDRGSLKEVAGGAACVVDPESIESIRGGLERLLADQHLRAELSRKGQEEAGRYSWGRTVDLVMEATEELGMRK